ncbi:FAD-dependent oxidoreductase [bacterium]|nr:FAD-dependent oxidoreductase [bacterium]
MRKADVVVIGGSAAGLTAAITCRRHYPQKSVLMIRKEEQVLIPCGIPYIFGTVAGPQKDIMSDAALEKNSIGLLIDEVSDIDPQGRVVITSGGEKVTYEKLIMAMGSDPMVLPIPGVDKKNVFTAKKEVTYLQKMLDTLDQSANLVIVGGGFIGVEFADECNKNRDINVSIVEMLPHCLMLAFDDELCTAAEEVVKTAGINIFAPEKVVAFEGDGKVSSARLESGKELPADMAILGIGAVASTTLAKKIGLELGPARGIKVNRYMRTSDDNIFACGDCADKWSFFDGSPSNIKLASIAAQEARIAGANLFGARRMNKGVVTVFSTVVGDKAFGLAGLSTLEAIKKGYNVVVGEAEAPNRHPGGMGGMALLKVKLVFEIGTGVILGGQIMGAKSGGELLNAISACIQQGMSVDDVAAFPVGTHPALTASPIAYQLTNAAEMAIKAMKSA